MLQSAYPTPVSEAAVIRRINRKLAHQEEKLVTLRGDRGRHDLGDHYVIDVRRNAVIQTHVDLEQLARELKVLGAGEKLAEGTDQD